MGHFNKMFLGLALGLGLTLPFSQTLAADSDTANDSDKTTSTSSKSLAERVKDLEKKLAAYQDGADRNFKQIHEQELRIHFNLYGDVEYVLSGPSKAFPNANSFLLGQTDLHLMGHYGPNLMFMSEDVVEFDGQDPSIDLERILVEYTFSDEFHLGAGRDHTCFGYWNRTFHHGAQLMTTIDRPFFLRFEDGGGSVPSHIVGVFAHGNFEIGGSSLKYEMNIGNGQSIGLESDGVSNITGAAFNLNPSGDNNNDKSFAGRLVFKPWSDKGLALGIAAVWNRYDVIAPSDLASNPLNFQGMGQVLLEGEVIYTDDNFEFLSEFYNFDNAIAGMPTQGSAKNLAFYIQAAYQITGDLKPYARVECLDVDPTDKYFLAMQQHNKTTYLLGLRYDLVSAASSIKVEGRAINDAGVTSTELATAWGFGF